MKSSVDDLVMKAALSDAVLHADRAMAALDKGDRAMASKWLLEAMMAYNKATLWLDLGEEQAAAIQHIKRAAERVGSREEP